MVGIEEQDQGHHDLDLDQDQSDRKYDKSWQTWEFQICTLLIRCVHTKILATHDALFMKLSNAKSMKERVPHLVALHIISMSVIASILEMIPKWNGVCIDIL
eukprot:gene31273-41671_t